MPGKRHWYPLGYLPLCGWGVRSANCRCATCPETTRRLIPFSERKIVLWAISEELSKMSWRVGFRINLKCTVRLLFYHACLLCVYVSLLVTQSKSKCWIPTFQAADLLFYQWEIRFSQSYYREPNCFIPRSQRISLASSGEPIQSCNLQSEPNFKPHLKKWKLIYWRNSLY